ncbi:DNA repair exonuclease [bacterium]|nr:DNA repair exonuclease [bacterium]
MSIRILLTSDLHLGMRFANYPPNIQETLIEARFMALENLVDQANAARCDLLVIAGDLFDRVSVAEAEILKAAQSLREFQGRLAIVLPGNHDYIRLGATDLWTHFIEYSEGNILVIQEKEIISLFAYDLNVNLYPGPCYSKHSSDNAIGWIKEIEKNPEVKHHIGIAHGSLEGFSPDFQRTYYPMTVKDLEECEMDIWLLGHTHVQYPSIVGPMDRIFYPATPEPDGFDCRHEGKAWIIEIDEGKSVIPTSLSTGAYRFLHDDITINNTADVETLRQKYSNPESKKTLLKLKTRGRLAEDVFSLLSSVGDEIDDSLFYLQWDDDEVTREISLMDIDSMFTQDSFPHRLLVELAKNEEDFEALQEAYELIKRVRR